MHDKQVFCGHPSRKRREEEVLHEGKFAEEIAEENLLPRVDAVISYVRVRDKG